MDIYREQILDHYKHPRNFGHLKNPDAVIEEGNVTCGDRIVIEVKIRVQGTHFRIQEISFTGEGCAISQASASMLTEKAKGLSMGEVRKIMPQDIFDMLGTTLTPSRTACALLSLEALQNGVNLLKNKKA